MELNQIAEEFDQCIKCGLCLATCPVCKELLLEKYTPRGKIQLARYYSRGDLPLSDQYRDIFAKCLLCGACTVTCPSGVDLKKVFLGMREEIVGKKGLHPMMEEVVRSVITNRNIADEDNTERAEWREPLKDLPEHLYEKDRAEVAYFIGCVSSFFPMVQKIPQNLVQIMDAAEVDFAVLGGEEWCCGFPLIGAGVPGKMEELIANNLENVTALGAKKVVFTCPSCQQTWKEFYNTDLELLHATQLIEKLVQDGAISFKEMHAKVTYHDPCDLGRHGGVFEAPRQILRAIPGLEIVELENNRAKSVCCGGGGNVEMADADLSGTVAQKKIEEIERTGADTVITSCQQCVRTIKSRARRQKRNIHVMDITDLVVQAMSGGKKH
jgi:heterodisulfide reductase subunit D